MSADSCLFCSSSNVLTTDASGDACCARCQPLLERDGCCGYCGEPDPVRMVGSWPACISCLNSFHARGVLRRVPGHRDEGSRYDLLPYEQVRDAARPATLRERIEAFARDAGVTGDIWTMTLEEYARRVLDARMMKLGLIKARGVDVTMQVVGNEVASR